MNDKDIELGTRIKKVRQSRGLTQLELAKRIGTSQTAIALWESGNRSMSLEIIERISIALSVSASYLLLGEEDLKDDLAVKDIKSSPLNNLTFSSKMPESIDEHCKNLLNVTYDNLSDNGKSDAYKLLEAYSKLNNTGQNEALKRVRELSKIEGYRKGDPEYDPDKPSFD